MREFRQFNQENQKTQVGLKSIAAFEAAKGFIVIIIGFGLFTFASHNLQTTGEQIVAHLHMNPAHKYPRIFMHALSNLGNWDLRLLALGAFSYSILRFVEALGLWLGKAWARWMAIISTAIYLPFEFFDLWEKQTAIRVLMTLLNLFLFFYLVKVQQRKSRDSR